MSSSFVERPRYTCALGGAMATVTALPGAIPLLHTPGGCAGNITWTQNGACGLQAGGYCGGLTVPSSNVEQKDVVFGGVDRLKEQIGNTLDVMEGELYFVLTGCVTEVIGDDVRGVVGEFQGKGVSLIFAETGGFKGNSYYGYDQVLQSLFKNFVQQGVKKIKGRVNVWGIAPYLDVFWRGNLEGLRLVLEKVGLEVNTFFTAADSLEGIRQAASAELNIVVSDIYGVNAAAVFEEVHGTPYLTTSLPVGPAATDHFLRQVEAALSLNHSQVEEIIARENHVYYQYLEPLVDSYNDFDLQRYSIVVGDGNYAPSITKYLADDLGWLPELVVITDQLEDELKERLASRFRGLESGLQPAVVYETDTSEIISHFNRHWPRNKSQKYYNSFSPAFVVGSSLDRELALALGAAHLSVSFPVANRAVLDRGYTGYRGGLHLAEDLLSAAVANR
ncbi:MAG TPA: hypothetical protein DCZ10_16745 [Pelotomaculum sp.]|nr:hypothetical protein [Pelotomaculum sp.]